VQLTGVLGQAAAVAAAIVQEHQQEAPTLDSVLPEQVRQDGTGWLT
jgi:hypothetical protein